MDKQQDKFHLIFRLDAENLFSRIADRKKEYIEIFALKRSREHFAPIFSNIYHKATPSDLSHCDDNFLLILNEFHQEAERLYWYLMHTEDMPNTMDDKVDAWVSRIGSILPELIAADHTLDD